VWVVVVACLAAVLGWGLSVVRTRRRSHLASRYYLDLSAEGLALAEGEARHQIAWAEVEGIWVDEERIQVVIERKGEEPLRIEPRYGGLGAYGLAEYLGSTLQNVLDS
ncbi:MAG: hypothetical protein KC416_14320, partial [Myxococcales bacterium]|nr:hypothetical protein [Myxococcales bacterium]